MLEADSVRRRGEATELLQPCQLPLQHHRTSTVTDAATPHNKDVCRYGKLYLYNTSVLSLYQVYPTQAWTPQTAHHRCVLVQKTVPVQYQCSFIVAVTTTVADTPTPHNMAACRYRKLYLYNTKIPSSHQCYHNSRGHPNPSQHGCMLVWKTKTVQYQYSLIIPGLLQQLQMPQPCTTQMRAGTENHICTTPAFFHHTAAFLIFLYIPVCWKQQAIHKIKFTLLRSHRHTLAHPSFSF